MSLDFSIVAIAGTNVMDLNITHNIANMWREAGCYDALYNSEGKKASEIVETLRKAVVDMQVFPEKYKNLNSPNGWGTYENALPFLRKILRACEEHPDGEIHISK